MWCSALYRAILHYPTMHRTSLCGIVLYQTVLCYAVMLCSVRHGHFRSKSVSRLSSSQHLYDFNLHRCTTLDSPSLPLFFLPYHPLTSSPHFSPINLLLSPSLFSSTYPSSHLSSYFLFSSPTLFFLLSSLFSPPLCLLSSPFSPILSYLLSSPQLSFPCTSGGPSGFCGCH